MADSSFLGAIHVSFRYAISWIFFNIHAAQFEGGARDANTLLNANLKSTTGITFGDGGAWAWFKPNSVWQSGNATPNTNSWINRTKNSMGDKLRPIFGVGGATVLLYPNGVSMNCMTSAVTFINVGLRKLHTQTVQYSFQICSMPPRTRVYLSA